MRIFIGHDSKYPQATEVCKQSMLNFNSKLNINVSDLIFEKPIKKKTYEDLKTKNFIPIIPEPEKIHLPTSKKCFIWRWNLKRLTIHFFHF